MVPLSTCENCIHLFSKQFTFYVTCQKYTVNSEMLVFVREKKNLSNMCLKLYKFYHVISKIIDYIKQSCV